MGKVSKAIKKQVQADLDRAFNEFIRFALDGLPEASPQYTGFFASSWMASKQRLIPSKGDYVQNYQPWSTIKQIKQNTLSSYPPYVSPRFEFEGGYRFGQTVYIGNKTEYAKYALASPKSKLIPFIGGLQSVAKLIFKTKSGAGLRIAGTSVPTGEPKRIKYLKT